MKSVQSIQNIFLESDTIRNTQVHFKNALDIILESQTMSGSRDLNIDEVMMDTSDMSRDEIVEYLKEKFHDENQRIAHHDSASSNVIHLYPPSDKLH